MSNFRRYSALLGWLLLPVSVNAADIVIGVPAWPSAQVTAHIIADTLQDYDVGVELKEKGTLTILAGIGRGEVTVHPEVWLPNLQGLVEKLEADGVVRLSANTVPATQNLCVTRETQELTGIESVTDLTDPKTAGRFDSDGDGRGELWIGAPTWSSTEIEQIRAHSYGYDQTMDLLEAPEDVAMASVDASAAVGRPIVFYCYGPHHVFELHDVVRLTEPDHDPGRWNIVKRSQDNEWLEKSRADTAYPPSRFQIAYATSLEQTAPEIAKFLSAIAFDENDITEMSYAVEVDRKSPEIVAREWLENHQDRVGAWKQ